MKNIKAYNYEYYFHHLSSNMNKNAWHFSNNLFLKHPKCCPNRRSSYEKNLHIHWESYELLCWKMCLKIKELECSFWMGCFGPFCSISVRHKLVVNWIDDSNVNKWRYEKRENIFLFQALTPTQSTYFPFFNFYYFYQI